MTAVIGRYPPAVVARRDTPLWAILRGFANRRVRHAPVLDGRKIVGIVSARDLFRRVVEDPSSEGLRRALFETTAGDVMTENPVTVQMVGGFAKVISKFMEKNVGAIPVLNRYGHVIGIISERHVADALAGHRTFVKVREIMSSPVITANPDSTMMDAAKTMVFRGIRRLPLEEGGEITGVFSMKDLIAAAASQKVKAAVESGGGEAAFSTRIGDLGSREVASVSPDADVSEALGEMRFRGVGSLLVMEDGKLKGIVTERDVVRRLPKLVGVETFVDVVTSEISMTRVTKYS